jgi:hypothetical protein
MIHSVKNNLQLIVLTALCATHEGLISMEQQYVALHRIPMPHPTITARQDYPRFVLQQTIPALAKELERAEEQQNLPATKELKDYILQEINKGISLVEEDTFLNLTEYSSAFEQHILKEITATWHVIAHLTALLDPEKKHDQERQALFSHINAPLSVIIEDKETFEKTMEQMKQRHAVLIDNILAETNPIAIPTK